MKKFVVSVTSLLAMLFLVSPAYAHVTVQPSQAGVGARTDFTVGVPNEKEIPTTMVRLVLPEGLGGVTPYVKPGWKISTKKSGEGEEAKVTEVTWSGGSIGEGLRDSFVFRAQTPASTTTLVWKAYQTYSDGTIVSWDMNPKDLENLPEAEKEENEKEGKGPYSETDVVNDLANESESKTETSNINALTTYVAYGALIIALAAITLAMRKRSS
jgi:uncharacterized protein YcnI